MKTRIMLDPIEAAMQRELLKAPEAERYRAYVQANSYLVPDLLRGFFGEAELTLPQKRARRLWKIMMSAISAVTTPFGRSQAWWLYGLLRTKAEHEEWWFGRRLED